MKRKIRNSHFVILACILLLTLCLTGCRNSSQPSSKQVQGNAGPWVNDRLDETPAILMIRQDESDYEYYQRTVLVTNDGGVYEIIIETSYEDYINLSSEDWFVKLTDAIEAGNAERKKSAPAGDMELILACSDNAAGYGSAAWKKYPIEIEDAGSKHLYTVYFDADGQPAMLLIAESGDSSYCLDHPDVISFVDEMIDRKYFSAYGHYGKMKEWKL